MMMWKLAIRNVFRNFRRTLLVMAMIIGGVCAIVIFRGFAYAMNWNLSEAIIRTQYGHVQILKKVVLENATVDTPQEKLLDKPDQLHNLVSQDAGVKYASGRISFFGLVTAGEKSSSAAGLAFDGKIETQMRDSLHIKDGSNLSFEHPMEVIIGSGMQERLKLKIGDNVTVLAQTYSGSINAVDLELKGIFETTISEIDNSTFILPLQAGQKLLDTDSFERLVVTTKSRDVVNEVKDRLQSTLGGGSDLVVRTWMELGDFYRKVDDFYRVQNLIVGSILMAITFLGILNTAGMAVYERTGEIGTARALGDTANDIVKQFACEGIVLGVVSCLLSIPISILAVSAVNALGIPIELPGASTPIIVRVDLTLAAYRDAFLTCGLTVLIATIIPAYRGTKLAIVDALRRNI